MGQTDLVLFEEFPRMSGEAIGDRVVVVKPHGEKFFPFEEVLFHL